MKQLSVMVMAGVMALGMFGCGSTAAEAPAESTAPAAESTAAETTESTVEAQTDPIHYTSIDHAVCNHFDTVKHWKNFLF